MHWQFGEMEFGEMKRNTSNWSNFCMFLRRAGLTASAGLSCLLLSSSWRWPSRCWLMVWNGETWPQIVEAVLARQQVTKCCISHFAEISLLSLMCLNWSRGKTASKVETTWRLVMEQEGKMRPVVDLTGDFRL